MTKGILPISYASKNLYFPILLYSFSPVQFLEQFPFPSKFAHLPFFFFFIKSPQPCFHKSYPKSKTFLNIRVVPSSAVFFSFFDVLPSAPTTTGMTLMLLMFHILLISLFSIWYLSIFCFSFSLTLMSPGVGISIMAQLLSFLFTATTSGFLALISLSHWLITSHKIFTSSFLTAPSGACSYHYSYYSLMFILLLLLSLLLQK